MDLHHVQIRKCFFFPLHGALFLPPVRISRCDGPGFLDPSRKVILVKGLAFQ